MMSRGQVLGEIGPGCKTGDSYPTHIAFVPFGNLGEKRPFAVLVPSSPVNKIEFAS